MNKIRIHTEYITLGQFLKLANIITNGGEAKIFLQSNDVYIDGILDNRRGRKLYPGMVVEILGQTFEIVS